MSSRSLSTSFLSSQELETKFLGQEIQALLQKNLELAEEEARAAGEDIAQFYENRPWEFAPAKSRMDPDDWGLIPPPDIAEALKIPIVKPIRSPNNPLQHPSFNKPVGDMSVPDLRKLLHTMTMNLSTERRQKLGQRIIEDVIRGLGSTPTFETQHPGAGANFL